VKRVATPDELAADPVGRYWLSETQLVWCCDQQTCGSAHWGQPDERDARELTRALELSRHPALAGGFEVFMDTSAIERVEWAAFSQLFEYVRGRLGEWATTIRRQAVVVPGGPAGALLAGMVPLLGMRYPLHFFPDAARALDDLGWRARPDAVAAIDEVTQVIEAVRSVSPTVQRLRAWLDGALDRPSLDSAAHALRLSPRSLQRELKAAATSFTAEVHAARVRVATVMLEDSDDKIEVIARAVGCASASQLSALFRRQVGETPARHRERLVRMRKSDAA
jgi:AraC-like DNA-binding protein